MSVGFGLLGSGFMAHTYAESLAKHVPDGHLVAVAEGTRAPGPGRRIRRPGPRRHGGRARPRRRRRGPHLHAALDPPGADRGGRGSRQARLHREADGRDPRRLRRDDRGLSRRPASCSTSTTSPAIAPRRSPPSGLIDDGSIGELRMVRILSSVLAYLTPEHGWAHKAGEGGAWLDMGVHLFDALRWFTGSEVEVIFAKVRDFARRPEPAPERPGRGRDAQRRHRPDADQLRDAAPGPRLAEPVDVHRLGRDRRVRFVRQGPARARRGLGGDLRDAAVRAQRGRLQPDPADGLRGADPAVRAWPSRPASPRPGRASTARTAGRRSRSSRPALRSSDSGESVHLPIDPA